MKSRRGFLSLLGLGAVVAPVAVVMAKAAPVAAKQSPGNARSCAHSNTHTTGDCSHTHTISDCSHTHSFTPEPREGERRPFFVAQTHGHGYDHKIFEYRDHRWIEV